MEIQRCIKDDDIFLEQEDINLFDTVCELIEMFQTITNSERSDVQFNIISGYM